jgi:peroxiredoxin Q/BCP
MNKVILTIIGGTVLLLIGIVFLSSGQSNQTNGAGGASTGQVTVGNPAPDFRLPSTDGRTITLADYQDKQNVLLYFHEGLTCQPCLDQVAELEKIKPQLDELNVQIFSVTLDNIRDQQKALARMGVTQIPSLSYETAQTEVDYDLTRLSMGMGRRAGHTFILVGQDGVISWRKDYWTGNGMYAPGGTMFVTADEILTRVQTALENQGSA